MACNHVHLGFHNHLDRAGVISRSSPIQHLNALGLPTFRLVVVKLLGPLRKAVADLEGASDGFHRLWLAGGYGVSQPSVLVLVQPLVALMHYETKIRHEALVTIE